MTSPIRSFALVSLAVLSVALAGPAAAETGDAAFLSDVKGAKLTATNGAPLTAPADVLLANGRATCTALSQGAGVHDISTDMSAATQLSLKSATFLVQTAISDLCPGNYPG